MKILRSIEVILIRHAESTENVALAQSMQAMQSLRSLRWPSLRQREAVQTLLLRYDRDADVSEKGAQQIEEMRDILGRENFWSSFSSSSSSSFSSSSSVSSSSLSTSVFCSTLLRARKTCLGILPEHLHSNIQYLDELRESTPFETLVYSSVESRIREFESILSEVEASKVVVVGHSQYFARMLNNSSYRKREKGINKVEKVMLRNCDIVRAMVTFSIPSNEEEEGMEEVGKEGEKKKRARVMRTEWSDVELLYRSQLSKESPFKSFWGDLQFRSGGDSSGMKDTAQNKEEEDEKRKL